MAEVELAKRELAKVDHNSDGFSLGTQLSGCAAVSTKVMVEYLDLAPQALDGRLLEPKISHFCGHAARHRCHNFELSTNGTARPSAALINGVTLQVALAKWAAGGWKRARLCTWESEAEPSLLSTRALLACASGRAFASFLLGLRGCGRTVTPRSLMIRREGGATFAELCPLQEVGVAC